MERAGSQTTVAQIGVATATPLIVAAYSLVLTFAAGRNATAVSLMVACALLLGTGAWLNRALLGTARTLVPFASAVLGVLLVWLWQWQAYAALVPPAGLPYGYFLTPQGATARQWVLAVPQAVGEGALAVCCLIAARQWWRTGARFSLLCMVPWWLSLLAVFSIPSIYLDWQGNASLFI